MESVVVKVCRHMQWLVPPNGAVWFGAVRFGVARFGAVRFGSVRCGWVRLGWVRCGLTQLSYGLRFHHQQYLYGRVG